MKLFDVLSLSTRMFKTRPMRTFLTVLGVSVGIGAVLFLVGLGYGLQNVILGRIASADALLTLDVAPGPTASLKLTPKNIEKIQALPSVKEVSRLKTYASQLTLATITSNTQVQAVDDPYFRLQGVQLIAGKFYEPGQKQSAILSSAAAKLFNLTSEDAVGKTVRVSLILPTGTGAVEDVRMVPLATPYTITGIVEDENTSSIFLPFESLSLSVDTIDQLKVRVSDNGSLEVARDALIAEGFLVSAISDVIDQANKIFRIVQIVLALFGLVALIVSAIGMFNTMTIALLERTSEIGIMRSIGVRRRDIRKLFLVESMLMGFLGGVGGVLIGVAAGWIANVGINILALRFGGTSLTLFAFPGWFIGVILVFSAFIGLLTGLYPSIRASSLNPLDALRYK